MKISRTGQIVVGAVAILLAVLALATRYQYSGQTHRLDRWTGQPQELYKGRWISPTEYEVLRDKENVDLREQAKW